MKLNIKFLALAILSCSILFFTACEKDSITTIDHQTISDEKIEPGQYAKSGTEDALIYLEIPEEYRAAPGEEMTVIEETGPFQTEDGEEVAGLIVLETTEAGGTFFTIGVSQNLIDLGVISSGDLTLLNKPWLDYYLDCMTSCIYAPPPLTCHNLCGAYASIAWLLQV